MSSLEYEYLSPSDTYANLQCPICHSPFTDPWMSISCEHFYCYTCIIQHLSTNSTCPCDRLPLRLSSAGSEEAHITNYIAPAPRLIKLLCDELEVQCTKCNTWKGQRGNWARHVDSGECATFTGKVISSIAATEANRQNKALDQGANLLQEQAGNPDRSVPVKCEMCKKNVVASTIESHSSECPAAPAVCPHCSLADLTNDSLDVHVASDCPEAVVPCPHTRFGCGWTGPRRTLVDQHLSTACPYEPLKEFILGNERQTLELQRENSQLRDDVQNLRNQHQDLVNRVERLSNRVGTSTTEREGQHSESSTNITSSVSQLGEQLSNFMADSERSRQVTEQSILDLRGEFGNFQMLMHDLRGEVMSLQQMQYFENASRAFRNRGIVPPQSASEGKLDSSSSDAPGSPINASGSQAVNSAVVPPYFTGQGHMLGYAYPQYAGQMLPPAPLLSPNSMLSSQRRMFGWPYPYPPYGPSGVPESQPSIGGATKL